MKSKLIQKVLVAGTGSIGRRHICNIQALRPKVSFAFLRDFARRDDFSLSLGDRVFGTIDEAIKWQPDIAVIATPSNRHHEIIGVLLRHGIASYIEKPVVIDNDQITGLLEITERVPATQVGCVLRFLPSLRKVKTWLLTGAVGKVVRASFEVGFWLPEWRKNQDYRQSYSASAARGGGVVLDLVHEIDLACWLFQADQLLGAWGGQLSSLDIDSEDVALLALRNRNGLTVAVQLDYVSRKPLRRLLVVGDQGSIHWDLPSQRCFLERPGQKDLVAEGFDTDRAYVSEIEELIMAVENGKSTSMPLSEGLRATRLAINANILIRRLNNDQDGGK